MEGFVAFKYLHVASMIFAVAVTISGELVLRQVAKGGDPRTIAVTIERIKPLTGPIAGLLFLAGIAFGFVAAVAGQFDLLRPWLIASYAVVALAFAIGSFVVEPWVGRLERAAAASADGPASAELSSVIDDPRAAAGSWALMALVAVLVFLMVVKPLG